MTKTAHEPKRPIFLVQNGSQPHPKRPCGCTKRPTAGSKRRTEFLPRDVSAERGYEIALRPSVRLSFSDDQVPCSNRFEFIENNFTAK